MMDEHKKMGCPIVFAGGIWTWGSVSLNYRQSIESTKPALKACINNGIRNVFLTLWGDCGCECDVMQALYGFQLYAEYNYVGEAAEEEVDKAFKICTGFDGEMFRLFNTEEFGEPLYAEEHEKLKTGDMPLTNISWYVLYQNPMLGMFDKNIEKLNTREHYKALGEKLSKLEMPDSMLLLFEEHKQLVKVLELKSDMGIRIKKAYDSKDNTLLKKLVDELKTLEKEIEKLHKMRYDLWIENNKPFGFEMLGNRMASLVYYIKNACNRLEEYLSGKVDFLEELEHERLYYDGKEGCFIAEWNLWRIINM